MASATEHLGTLFAFLFFTGLQVWPLIYLAWFVQTAVGEAGCSDLSSTAHLVAKIIVWTDIAGVILMFIAVIAWYGREKGMSRMSGMSGLSGLSVQGDRSQGKRTGWSRAAESSAVLP